MSESEDSTPDTPGAEKYRPIGELLHRNRLNSDPADVIPLVLNISMIAALTSAWIGWTTLSVIITVAVLVVLLWKQLPLLDLASSQASLGRQSQTRLLVIATIGTIAATTDRPVSVIGWLALTGFGLLVLAEAPLRKIHGLFPATANLPGAPENRAARIPVTLIHPATLLTASLALVSALTSFPWFPALIIILLAGAVGVADLMAQLRAVRRSKRDRKQLIAAISAYQPTFALYWRADPGTEYQISMWLPFLEKIGKPFIVIVRTQENLNDAAALTTRPVVLGNTMSDLDAYVVESMKTVFYVNNANQNTHMVRYPGLKHIMLNHGDSDKSPSYNPVSRMYDRNFVAGQAAIDRFSQHGVEVPESQFAIVGRPQITNVERSTVPITEKSRPRVLYAPTWAGFTADASYSSLAVAPAIIENLIARGCDVIFRPHPWARRSPRLDRACTEITALLKADSAPNAHHVYGAQAESEWGVVDCFNNSDAMISDVSGVVPDYLYSEKPLALVSTSRGAEEFVAEFPLAAAAYVLDASSGAVTDLDQRLDELLLTDPGRRQRLELKTYYLGDPGDRPYEDLFFDEVARFV